jgi:non-canonical (house-cleaning) NTP pyrophosphatase
VEVSLSFLITVEKIGERHFESGWVCVIDQKTGIAGFGSSGRFELSEKIMIMIYDGMELAQVMDALTGEIDVRNGAGAMGILTNGLLNRAEAYGRIQKLTPRFRDSFRLCTSH